MFLLGHFAETMARDGLNRAQRPNAGSWKINAYRPEGRLEPRSCAAFLRGSHCALVRSSSRSPSGSPCHCQVSSDPSPIISLRTFTGFSSGRNRSGRRSGSKAGVLLKNVSTQPSLISGSRALPIIESMLLIRTDDTQSFKNFCISLDDLAIKHQLEAGV